MKLQEGILVFLFLTVGLIYGDEKATKTKVRRCLTLFAPAHILHTPKEKKFSTLLPSFWNSVGMINFLEN